MTFDEQVAALRGTVEPRPLNKKKCDSTPEQWAAFLDYKQSQWHLPHVRERNTRHRQKGSTKARANANRRSWYSQNKQKMARWVRKYEREHPEKRREWLKRRIAKDPGKHRAKRAALVRRKRESDPAFRMMDNLRTRQRKFFKGTQRPASMVRDMGCDREFFLRHIASQFTAGMTMENYGTVWHLDHIYPLSKASIVDNPIHFLAAANWRNLRPLPGPENIEKSDEITPEAQALFDSLVEEFTRKVVAA